MTVRISAALKAAIVALATVAWLTQAHASVGRALALAAGAALVAFGWIVLSAARAVTPAPPVAPLAEQAYAEQQRVPTGRPARDVRCPASHAGARPRRSSRR